MMPVDAGYIVDDPEPFTVTKNEFSNGVAGFRIEADQDETLAVLVALAYDAQGQIRWSWTGHGVQIPDGDSAHWRIQMSPTTSILATSAPAPDIERIAEWPHPKGHPSCLLLEHWDDSSHAKREMLSPADDFDCDGVDPSLECEPFIPNAMGVAPSIDSANCVTPVAPSGGSTAYVCMLGGPQCNEVPTMPSDTCAELDTPYCTPISTCQCVNRPDTQACIRTLVVGATSDQPTMPFMKCTIGVDQAGNRCDTGELSVDASPFLGIGRGCKDLRVGDATTPIGPFENALHIGDGAKLKFNNFIMPCAVEVSFEGTQTAPHVEYGFFDVALDNGYHLLTPAKVDVHLGCTVPSQCGVVMSNNTNESMFQCVDAMGVTPACAPDQAHGCNGPYCNGECCGYGERCTPNGCSCNGGGQCGGGDTCQQMVSNPDQCGILCCGVMTGCPF